MARLKMTGYVDAEELDADATDTDGRVPAGAWDEIAGHRPRAAQ